MFRRYAIFYTPGDGLLAEFGAAWLGWNPVRGATVPHPDLPELDVAALTATPHRYGLHATLKPPFRLATGTDADALARAVGDMAAALAPAGATGLTLVPMGRFLVLCPLGDTTALSDLAGVVMRGLDRFRAPPTAAELERRRARPLTETQKRNLMRWGYPHVNEDFRFHITLTDRLPKPDIAPVMDALRPVLDPLLPVPFHVDALTLMGEDTDGMFHVIDRYPLGDADQSRP